MKASFYIKNAYLISEISTLSNEINIIIYVCKIIHLLETVGMIEIFSYVTSLTSSFVQKRQYTWQVNKQDTLTLDK